MALGTLEVGTIGVGDAIVLGGIGYLGLVGVEKIGNKVHDAISALGILEPRNKL